MAQSAQIAKVNPWHQRFADWLILHGAEPGWNAKAAKEFGRTPAWISTVYHSDAFQDYYKGLRAEHTATLIHSISDKLNGAAGQALDLLQEKLELEGPSLPFDTILETVDVLTKRAIPVQSKNETNIQVALVSKEELQAFRDKMRQRREGPEVIELQATDISTSNSSEVPSA